MMVNICTGFTEIPRTVSEVWSGQDFHTKITNRRSTEKMNVEFDILCISFGKALFLFKVSLKYLRRFEYSRHYFHTKIYRAIFPQRM